MIVAEKTSGETWSWRGTEFKTYTPQLRYDYDNNIPKMVAWLLLYKVGALLEYIFAFGVISGINALFIRVVLKVSGLMIFPMISVQNYFSRRPITFNQRRLIYQSMGDMGALAAYLDREGISRSIIYLTYCCSLALYYVMYIACSHLWTIMCFSSLIYSDNINQSYFFYVNMLELCAFIFLRTRSSIKYFPKIISLANILFLFYINSTMYASQYEALALLQNFSIFMLFFFLSRYEYEAVNNWNPFGTWTPSEVNPRCAYQHVLASPNYAIGFDVLSMTMPVHFRERFTPESRAAFSLL